MWLVRKRCETAVLVGESWVCGYTAAAATTHP